MCPIAGLEMNGKFKFVFDWGKGRVLSERGHKIVMKVRLKIILPFMTTNPVLVDSNLLFVLLLPKIGRTILR